MKKIIALILVMVMALALAGCAGGTKITVEVTHLDGTVNTYELNTKADNLYDAMLEEDLIVGEDSDYGIYVLEVDGEAADAAQEQWWGYTKGGEYVDVACDSVEIADGDKFEFTLNVGYDF